MKQRRYLLAQLTLLVGSIFAASASYPAWKPNTFYTAGTVVSYNGGTYQAILNQTDYAGTGWTPLTAGLWNPVGPSSAGTTPSPSPTSQPSPSPTSVPTSGSASNGVTACSTAWNAATPYTGGSKVSYSNMNYVANWWTQNQSPASYSGGNGSGQPWTVISACSSGGTPTPTSNPTPTTTPTTNPTPTSTPTPATNPTPSPTTTPQPTTSGGSVPGWPSYLAMGAIGGPDNTPPTATSTGGNDDFGGRPVDVVFKYAGVNGNGDPGMIDPPTNAYRMTADYNILSPINKRAMRVAIVEYTAQMSGGASFDDFTNGPAGLSSSNTSASYLMGRHFSSLAADALMLASNPVKYNGNSYYGSLLMNPDLLGAMQQNSLVSQVNGALPAGAVNTAVAQAMCLMTNTRSYTNKSNPNGLTSAPYLGKTYTGTPVQILTAMLADGYPEWSFDSLNDPFWNTSVNNYSPANSNFSQVGAWFNACVSNPSYNTSKYAAPNFPAGFAGWVAANDWVIRALAPKGTVTYGWQDNMWAVGSGFWLHQTLNTAQIAANYSTPVSNWLNTNAPGAINSSLSYGPDFFLFDRYEMDDSAAPGAATLYNARSWDNFLTAVGQVSKANNNIPVMLWQIPGSHIPNTKETAPELFQNTSGSYAFSTAPVYFFGDSNLSANLSNIILGTPSASNTNTAVGNYLVACGATAYNCLSSNSTYQQYLMEYAGKSSNYNWSIDNGKLAFAASNNVFAILWGGGNTTNVIKNFSNTDDHGWLAGKISNYYNHPTPVVKH